jgi:hypothetical protein
MTLKVGGAQAAQPTSAGSVDLTPAVNGEVADVFADDVAGALAWCTNSTANGISAGALLALGFGNGTNEAGLCVAGADAVTTSDWHSRINNTKAIQVRDTAGSATLAEADLALITNGISLDYTTADAVARRISALIFGGTGVECRQVTAAFTSGAGGETVEVDYGTAFAGDAQPDFVIAFLNGNAINTNLAQGRSSIGCYARVADTYVALLSSHQDNQTTEQASGIMLTDCIAGEIASGNNSAQNYKVTLGNFDGAAHTFDMISSAAASTDGICFFLFYCPNLAVATGTVAMPTDTNEFTVHTGLGKRPKCILALPSRLASVDSGSTADAAGFAGITAAYLNNGAVEQLCCGISTDDGATGTNALINKSITHARWVQTLGADGTTNAAGDIVAFTDDGATGQLTTAPAAAQQIGYIIFGDEDIEEDPLITGVDPDPLVEGDPFTITGSGFNGTTDTVTHNGVSQTVTADAVDEITATAVLGTNTYGDELTLEVDNGTTTVSVLITTEPATGEGYDNLSGGVNSDTAIRLTSVPDLADNAQIHKIEAVDAEATPIPVTDWGIYPDGTPWVDEAYVLPAVLTVRANNRDGEGWGAQEDVTVEVAEEEGDDGLSGFGVGLIKVRNRRRRARSRFRKVIYQ